MQFDASMVYLDITVHKIYCWAFAWKPYTKLWIVLMLMDFPHIPDFYWKWQFVLFWWERGWEVLRLDGYLRFEPRVAQLCRLEAFAFWGEVTLPEVLCSWWEMQAMPYFLSVSWHLL